MGAAAGKRTVLIIATLDTKSEEVIHLRGRILSEGLDTLILDTGVLGEPCGITPDIPAAETARAAGTTLEALRKVGTRGLAIDEMLKGARTLTARLCSENRIYGAMSMGGAEGGIMAAAAMQVLPPGFPKLIITPLASGVRPFGPFIGVRDITVMHSLVDIAGINEISRVIFDNAAAAVCGMVKAYRPMEVKSPNLVAITTLGTTDRALRFVLPRLEQAGYIPVIFHSSGVGGQVMEDMIGRGYFCGVVDLCINELTDHLVGAYHDAGPHRLEAAGKVGIPQVVSTGCVDFFAQGAKDTVPEKWRDRPMYYHNPKFTLIRPTHAEMRTIGATAARKLSLSRGPVTVVLPLNGMSYSGLKGGSTHDPEGDRILFESLKAGLRADITVVEAALHVNEEPFAALIVNEFVRLMSRAPRRT
jgi:uncharacterized protein (UPF0261 family)